jgi:2-keto-4-pentenoate hydratase/2-oxohepta-3-ene-1,7-dioic acid hydratase in catechol pathway/regulator of RNase E activity RraA
VPSTDLRAAPSSGLSAIPPPTKIIAVHVNYSGRASERGRRPDFPSYFFKPVSSLAGDGDTVVRPRGTELLVFEGEIAVIIGRRTRNVTPEGAAGAIGWYAAANDYGLHDLRWADRGSNVLTKGHDGFTPLSAPVAAAEVDRNALRVITRVNGKQAQDETIAGMLFSFELLIADLSRFMTLEPGDIILTGTPAGARPVEPGDQVEVEVSGVGSLRNRIVESDEDILPFGAQPRVEAMARAAAFGSNGARRALVSPEAAAALRTVSTATLTTQLARRGIRNCVLADLAPTRPDLRLFGYAFTLRYLPLREDVRDADDAELNAQKLAVESIGPDEVLVIDARRDPHAGTIGDILAARVLGRGAAGIVTDGGLRDSAAVAGLELPVYYQATHPAPLGAIHYPADSNLPIACGGALVVPGDVIVGDTDGVVVVPAGLAEEVAVAALEQEQREDWALERVRAGESIRGVYPVSEARRPEYQAWLEARGDGARSVEKGPA